MKLSNIIRYSLLGCLYGVFMSWLIGDELIGMIVIASMIIIFELLNKFVLQKGDEQ